MRSAASATCSHADATGAACAAPQGTATLVLADFRSVPAHLKGRLVATIGNFDGVHRGHRALVERVQRRQQQLCGLGLVILFEPQPKEYFLGPRAPRRIFSLERKLEVLRELGVDVVLVLAFDQALRSLGSAAFIGQILIQGLAIRHLVMGDDFRFGNDRQGDYALLQRTSAAGYFGLERAPTLSYKDQRISSTLIRQCLQEGDIDTASFLLSTRKQLSFEQRAG